MVKEISLKELRPQLPKVIDSIDRKMDRYIVSRRGKTVAVMMSMDDYESLLETLEVLSDRQAIRHIQQGIRQVKRGAVTPWESIKKKHRLS